MEDQQSQTFAQRLITERKRKGYSSQRELAEALGVSPVTINFYEQGKRKPDYEMFAQIANLLEVSYDYMLGESQHRTHQERDTLEGTAKLLAKAAQKVDPALSQESLDAIDAIFSISADNKESGEIVRCLNTMLTSFFHILLNHAYRVALDSKDDLWASIRLYAEARKREAQDRIERLPQIKHPAKTQEDAFANLGDKDVLNSFADRYLKDFSITVQNEFQDVQGAVTNLIEVLQKQLDPRLLKEGAKTDASTEV